jgi:hypothetical protein
VESNLDRSPGNAEFGTDLFMAQVIYVSKDDNRPQGKGKARERGDQPPAIITRFTYELGIPVLSYFGEVAQHVHVDFKSSLGSLATLLELRRGTVRGNAVDPRRKSGVPTERIERAEDP